MDRGGTPRLQDDVDVRLRSLRHRFRTIESGATLVEYAVLLAVIAVAYCVASSMLGTAILWGVVPRP
jgi:Flp pilus assembly pilin Flp